MLEHAEPAGCRAGQIQAGKIGGEIVAHLLGVHGEGLFILGVCFVQGRIHADQIGDGAAPHILGRLRGAVGAGVITRQGRVALIQQHLAQHLSLIHI